MRLIDADALDKLMGEMHLSLLNQYGSYDAFAMGYESAVCAVEAAPTIDAVPVVRCRDCKYLYIKDMSAYCRFAVGPLKPDGYCSCGERRGDA